MVTGVSGLGRYAMDESTRVSLGWFVTSGGFETSAQKMATLGIEI